MLKQSTQRIASTVSRSVGKATALRTLRSISSLSTSKFNLSKSQTPLNAIQSSKSNFHNSATKFSDGPLSETVRDFLSPKEFYDLLQDNGFDFFAGVPDSLLKDFCAYVQDNTPAEKHVITSNEGSSVALAAGYHMASRKFPVVYMQNSGFGNTVNPLLSLTDPQVYSIPMLLLIGWRGEPGKRDEPQHGVQGKVMTSLLTDLGIQYDVLPDYKEGAEDVINSAVHHMKTRQAPYALLVKRQAFEKYNLKSISPNTMKMSREEAIDMVIDAQGKWDVNVSTTGFASRELYELREKREEGHEREFLTVGSMGHAGSIAMGIAVAKPSRQVFCLDGDGGFMMHMGSVTTMGQSNCSNLKHVLLNNGAHDSVGGQPSLGFNVDFPTIAAASGYKWTKSVHDPADLPAAVAELRDVEGPAMLEIKVNKGARKDLGRPKSSPKENKTDLMSFLDG